LNGIASESSALYDDEDGKYGSWKKKDLTSFMGLGTSQALSLTQLKIGWQRSEKEILRLHYDDTGEDQALLRTSFATRHEKTPRSYMERRTFSGFQFVPEPGDRWNMLHSPA